MLGGPGPTPAGRQTLRSEEHPMRSALSMTFALAALMWLSADAHGQ